MPVFSGNPLPPFSESACLRPCLRQPSAGACVIPTASRARARRGVHLKFLLVGTSHEKLDELFALGSIHMPGASSSSWDTPYPSNSSHLTYTLRDGSSGKAISGHAGRRTNRPVEVEGRGVPPNIHQDDASAGIGGLPRCLRIQGLGDDPRD